MDETPRGVKCLYPKGTCAGWSWLISVQLRLLPKELPLFEVRKNRAASAMWLAEAASLARGDGKLLRGALHPVSACPPTSAPALIPCSLSDQNQGNINPFCRVLWEDAAKHCSDLHCQMWSKKDHVIAPPLPPSLHSMRDRWSRRRRKWSSSRPWHVTFVWLCWNNMQSRTCWACTLCSASLFKCGWLGMSRSQWWELRRVVVVAAVVNFYATPIGNFYAISIGRLQVLVQYFQTQKHLPLMDCITFLLNVCSNFMMCLLFWCL